jgi:broad specificity phosphatase PhoE
MSSAALILVRHAAPEIAPGVPPRQWRLSEAGRAGAAALAEQIAPYRPAASIASPEPKALETARILARRLELAVEVDPDLAEHRRPELPFVSRDEFEARMRSLFARPAAPFFGGESADQARARFTAAIGRHAARPLLVGTHATVLSLYVAERAGMDPFELWRGLALPEAVVLGADGGVVARLR